MTRNMNTATVEEIIELIDQLSDDDRDRLNERLRQRVEDEWQRRAEKIRAEAKAKGITQEVIDEAVMRVRYGS